MDHLEALLALRGRLLATVVATTGVTTLTATGTGYTRATGSFITDGFRVGMEVVPSGFADNSPGVIQSLTDLEIVLMNDRDPEGAAANRSLTVGIPQLRGWENFEVKPLDGRWFVEEDYIPGPRNRVGVMRSGPYEHLPQYIVRLSGLSDTGVTALYTVAQEILDQFPPGDAFSMADGQPLRVASSPAPSRGQVLPGLDSGRAEIVITIPLWKRTHNPI